MPVYVCVCIARPSWFSAVSPPAEQVQGNICTVMMQLLIIFNAVPRVHKTHDCNAHYIPILTSNYEYNRECESEQTERARAPAPNTATTTTTNVASAHIPKKTTEFNLDVSVSYSHNESPKSNFSRYCIRPNLTIWPFTLKYFQDNKAQKYFKWLLDFFIIYFRESNSLKLINFGRVDFYFPIFKGHYVKSI